MEDCLFCKIADHKITANIRYEDNQFIAFDDINPKAPTHVLLIPKKHYSSINDLKKNDIDLMGNLILTAQKIARELKIDESGYRIVSNTGPDSGQIVPHLHFHIIGGTKLGNIA